MDPQRTLTDLNPAQAGDAEPLGSLLRPDRLSQWAWTLGYTALLSMLSVFRYHVWLAAGYDLGLFRQGLWLIMHKGLLAASTYTGHPILADGASYILVLLAPVYQVGGVGLLLVLQAFAFGLGYVFIRRIAEQVGVSDKWAHVAGVIYLLYPTVLGANLFDFHPDAFGIPILLALIWAALAENWLAYGVLLVASLLVKDTVPILLLGTGIVLVIQRRTGWGIATLIAAALGYGADAYWLLPQLTHGAVSPGAALYGPFGIVLSHPQHLLAWVRSLHDWEYLVWMFGPVAALAAAARRRALNPWWIPVLLFLEVNLLSPSAAMTSPFNEMSVLVVPFVFVAALIGLRAHRVPARRLTSGVAAIATAFFLVFTWHDYHVNWTLQPSNASALAQAAALIPRDAPVVAPNFAAAHLADRAEEWLPASAGALPRGTYILLDPAATTRVTPPSVYAGYLRIVSNKANAVTVYSQSQVTLYRLLRPVTHP